MSALSVTFSNVIKSLQTNVPGSEQLRSSDLKKSIKKKKKRMIALKELESFYF